MSDVIYKTDLHGDEHYVVSVDERDEIEIYSVDGNNNDVDWLMFLSKEEAVGMAKAILNHYETEIRINYNSADVDRIINAIKAASAGTIIEVNT